MQSRDDRRLARRAARATVTVVAIFAVAMLLITVVEVLLGHSLPGGPADHTTIGDLLLSAGVHSKAVPIPG